MPDFPKALSTEDRKALSGILRWSKVAFWISIASLIVAITAIITIILW